LLDEGACGPPFKSIAFVQNTDITFEGIASLSENLAFPSSGRARSDYAAHALRNDQVSRS